MKTRILKIAAILFAMSAALIVATAPGVSHNARAQNTAPPNQPTEKTVDQIGKNIKVLNGTPQSQLYPIMRFMAVSLGFQCGNCHVIRDGRIDAPLDEKPEKQTARQMIKMVSEINQLQFQGNPMVSCYTCHRGSRSPQGVPVLPLPAPPARPPATPASASTTPSVDEVLSKYLAAIGGNAADQVKSITIKGTTTTAIGQTVAYEAEQVAPDKGHETFAIEDPGGRCAGDSRCEYERVINGPQGWLKSGAGVQELVGQQLGDEKLSFPLFSIFRLRDQYSGWRVSARDKIAERNVYVISASRFDGKLERLYFDVESGLLRRRVGYLRTLVGMIPQQMDFEDYREVAGLKLPFLVTISYADAGSRPIVRKFTEIKLNVSVAESRFDKPQ